MESIPTFGGVLIAIYRSCSRGDCTAQWKVPFWMRRAPLIIVFISRMSKLLSRLSGAIFNCARSAIGCTAEVPTSVYH